MEYTDPLKEALAWADRNKNNPLACDHKPMIDTLAAAVRSRDLKPDGSHDRCNAGLRSLLKTAEEEIAGLREALVKAQYYIHKECEVGKCFRLCRDLKSSLAATKTGEKL